MLAIGIHNSGLQPLFLGLQYQVGTVKIKTQLWIKSQTTIRPYGKQQLINTVYQTRQTDKLLE